MWTLDTQQYLEQWRSRYAQDLTTDILPFWLKHGWDQEHGGVYTCVDRDGNLMDTTKSVWFQGRCGFIFAYAYNNIEKKQEYLDFSKSCIDFIEAHCIDTDGRMYFEVTGDGQPLRKRRYVFSECFAAIAMAEYAIASGDRSYAEKSLRMFESILRFIETPGVLAPKYLPTQPSIGHSVTMILINTAARVRAAAGDSTILKEQIDRSLYAIQHYFLQPEYKAVLEMVTPDGKLIDTLNGRVINPGHCIETSWFIFDEAMYRGGDKDLVNLGLQILDWSWDWGWDETYGGIINFRDCKNLPPQDYSQDMKFWWPQTEGIIATLYAYQLTGDTKYLERHRMVNEWAYNHLADPEHEEWYGYLHRDGTVAQPAKGNIFKGPFHIPRMMIKSHILLTEILKQ